MPKTRRKRKIAFRPPRAHDRRGDGETREQLNRLERRLMDLKMLTLGLAQAQLDLSLGRLSLERDEARQACLKRPRADQLDKNPVYIVTLPKSGSYLLIESLVRLGYQDVTGALAPDEYAEIPTPLKKDFSYLPYEVVVKLIRPGQVFFTHILNASSVQRAHPSAGRDSILFAVRDLRYSLVSFLRFYRSREEGRREDPATLTGEKLLATLNTIQARDSFAIDFYLGCIRGNIALKDNPVVKITRVEELTASDPEKMSPSVQAIAGVTGFGEDEIREALKYGHGRPSSPTFSGRNTTLSGLWNDSLENYFVRQGLDELNEQLGYGRDCPPLSSNPAV